MEWGIPLSLGWHHGRGIPPQWADIMGGCLSANVMGWSLGVALMIGCLGTDDMGGGLGTDVMGWSLGADVIGGCLDVDAMGAGLGADIMGGCLGAGIVGRGMGADIMGGCHLCPEVQVNEVQCSMYKHHKVSFSYHYVFDRIMCFSNFL